MEIRRSSSDQRRFYQRGGRKEVDSINAFGPDARTAVGVTDDGFVLIACVADRKHDPQSIGLSLKELAEMMHDLGCVKRSISMAAGRQACSCGIAASKPIRSD